MIQYSKTASNFKETTLSCEVLFLQPSDSDFYQCLIEGLGFVERYPEVLNLIEHDQDQHGLNKKRTRILDRACEHEALEQLPFLSHLSLSEVIEVDVNPLQIGRPRMNTLTVFFYLLSEAYLGGSTTSRISKNYLADSQTIYTFLTRHQLKVPGASTIHDNLRCISPVTIEKIFDLQVSMIKNDQLDSFEKIFIDSTSVHANSTWPTDSSIMLGLAKRLLKTLQNLYKKFSGDFGDKVLSRWIEELDKVDFEIVMVKGKKNAAVSRKKLYGKFLKKIGKFSLRIAKKMIDFREKYKYEELKFSKKQQIDVMIDIFSDSITDMLSVSEYCHKRIFDEEKISSREKILSLSDGDAAFIVKGQRDTVLGYKPQIAVSDNMFIASVIVPEGNAADSEMLTLTVEDVIERTGITPKLISTDDGYVSKENQERLKEQGIETVSFSGSKGKKLLKEEWDKEEYVKGRKDRSKAESIMFSLKHLFDFGQLKRRGIDPVRAELTMKSVIYNFYHIAKKKKMDSKDPISISA
jgi:hypothetical protein